MNKGDKVIIYQGQYSGQEGIISATTAKVCMDTLIKGYWVHLFSGMGVVFCTEQDLITPQQFKDAGTLVECMGK